MSEDTKAMKVEDVAETDVKVDGGAAKDIKVEDVDIGKVKIEADDVKIEDVNIEEVKVKGKRKIKVAVAGCVHGEMDKVYELVAHIEKTKNIKVDLLICCGDYQAVRNFGDLNYMHVNDKYKDIRTFYKYYSGEVKAPVLTVFIGGNHEASNYLSELPNGGWVAPNIYYMGFASVVQFAGLRIGGISGIYNRREFNTGHFERPPYKSYGDVISAYHIREVDVYRLKQLRPSDEDKISNGLDIFLSHDWPSGIVDYGDSNILFSQKPYFKSDHMAGRLGSPASMQLLYDVRPKYWFAAHLHCCFPALVEHKGDGNGTPEPTRFLALDKSLPRRKFLQILDFEVEDDAELALSHDPTWLAILKKTDSLTLATSSYIKIPSSSIDYRPTEAEVAAIASLGDLRIDVNGFRQTAPPLMEITEEAKKASGSSFYVNPQTSKFCEWLGIADLNKKLAALEGNFIGEPFYIIGPVDGTVPLLSEADKEKFGDCDFIIDRGDEDITDDPEAKRPRLDDDIVEVEPKNEPISAEE